jgi:cyclase
MLSCGALEGIGPSHEAGIMQINRLSSVFTALIRPAEGANVGLIHTPQGMVLIDTASSAAEIRSLLDAISISARQVSLVINTHSHSDHTWGNQLFDCPILAQRACRHAMQSALGAEWSPATFQSYIADLEQTDPQKARDFRQVVDSLVIKLPDRVFEDRFEGELGDVRYEVIHYGGHSPGLSVVWLPESKALYASDLIFQGRYPYIFDADIPRWISALETLRGYQAGMVIPGHGLPCGDADILVLRDYLQCTWEMAERHFRLGHSAEEASIDPAFPIFPGEKYERLHRANIIHMYNLVQRKNH